MKKDKDNFNFNPAEASGCWGCLIIPQLMGGLTRMIVKTLFIAGFTPFAILFKIDTKGKFFNPYPSYSKTDAILDTAIGLAEIGLLAVGGLYLLAN